MVVTSFNIILTSSALLTTGLFLLYLYSYSVYGRIGRCTAYMLNDVSDEVYMYIDKGELVFENEPDRGSFEPRYRYRCLRVLSWPVPIYIVKRDAYAVLQSVESGKETRKKILLFTGLLSVSTGAGLLVSPSVVPLYAIFFIVLFLILLPLDQS